MQNTDENIRELKEVVRRETPRLLRLPRVLSVGVALKLRNGLPTETLCVRVTVKKKKLVEPANTNINRIEDVIRVSGYAVDVIEVEDETELSEPRICDVPESEARTGSYDVLKGGIGIYTEKDGVKQPYGTLGMVVYDRISCQPYILTTHDILHSWSMNKTGQYEHTKLSLYQGDDGTPVGELYRSDYNLNKTKDNFILSSDFLIIKITSERDLLPEVEGIEFERIFLEPKLGMPVYKSGARTGVTEGIITKIDGFEFRVSSETEVSFSCPGDAGAIIFGDNDGKKRPIGIVTIFNENSADKKVNEVRCVSLKPVLIGNSWMDITLLQEGPGPAIHRFWNSYDKKSYYNNFNSNNIDETQRFMFQYEGPTFFGVHPSDPASTPIHSWFNPSSKQYFYTIDDLKSESGTSFRNVLKIPVVPENNIYVGKLGYASTKRSTGMVELQAYKNNSNGDFAWLTRAEIKSNIFSDYQAVAGAPTVGPVKTNVNPTPKVQNANRFIVKVEKGTKPDNMVTDYVPDMVVDYFMGSTRTDLAANVDPRYVLGQNRNAKNTNSWLIKRWNFGVSGWMLLGFTKGFMVSDDRFIDYFEIGTIPECLHIHVAVSLLSTDGYTNDRPVDYAEYVAGAVPVPYVNSLANVTTDPKDSRSPVFNINPRVNWLGNNWKYVGDIKRTGIAGVGEKLNFPNVLPRGTYYYMLIQDASHITNDHVWDGADITHIGVYPTPADKKHYLLIIDDSATIGKGTKQRYEKYISTFLRDIYMQDSDVYLGVRLIRWKPGMKNKTEKNESKSPPTPDKKERTERLQFKDGVDTPTNWIKINDVKIDTLIETINKVLKYDGNETPIKEVLEDVLNIDINIIKNHKGKKIQTTDNFSLNILSDGLPDPFIAKNRKIMPKDKVFVDKWQKMYTVKENRDAIIKEITKGITEAFRAIVKSVGGVLRKPSIIGNFDYTGEGDAKKMGSLIKKAYSEMKDADGNPLFTSVGDVLDAKDDINHKVVPHTDCCNIPARCIDGLLVNAAGDVSTNTSMRRICTNGKKRLAKYQNGDFVTLPSDWGGAAEDLPVAVQERNAVRIAVVDGTTTTTTTTSPISFSVKL